MEQRRKEFERLTSQTCFFLSFKHNQTISGTGFLETPRGEKWVENQVESESPFYYTTLALLVQSWQRWKSTRLIHLERLLVAAHCRIHLHKGGETLRKDKQVLEYAAYKPALVFFALVNGIYEIVLKVNEIDLLRFLWLFQLNFYHLRTFRWATLIRIGLEQLPITSGTTMNRF